MVLHYENYINIASYYESNWLVKIKSSITMDKQAHSQHSTVKPGVRVKMLEHVTENHTNISDIVQ